MRAHVESAQVSQSSVVLVVDDDPDIRDALRDVLEEAGYQVAEAGHGAQALAYLASQPPPAAILLDLFMPVMDGWQFARQMQSVPALAAIPIIVVTASGRHWGYPSGKVLRKPLDLHELLQTLRELPSPARAPAG